MPARVAATKGVSSRLGSYNGAGGNEPSMMQQRWNQAKGGPVRRRLHRLALAAPGLIVASASCVPTAEFGGAGVAALNAPIAAAAVDAPLPPDAVPAQAIEGEGALAANQALGLSGLPNPAASPFVVRGLTALDRLRSHDCLAQAIYYEAASESEDGQRAVAQVVLNRVRHPSWPNSVCGVVYQGPMRAGGGCQFTFTCDGSLARRAGGESWLRARRIAAEALNGRTFAPVGHSTFYHTHAVFPAWAPRLAKTTVIGAHIFYRLPGGWGEPSAFRASYAGREPMPRPAMTMLPAAAPGALPPAALIDTAYVPPLPTPERVRAAPVLPVEMVETSLPQPQIREEYRNSGQWRTDAPVAPPVREGR
jgi:hypothetical protein